jgi:hypothetical protein
VAMPVIIIGRLGKIIILLEEYKKERVIGINNRLKKLLLLSFLLN